ncbi:MAG TPA: hypothetical protein VGR76_13105, partial [Candidatus Angelobacter sp.]|nr:hypothetical protein [Candidatus Angelobacter sp.]
KDIGHVPSLLELLKISPVRRHAIRKNFVSYREALVQSGLERQGTYRLDLGSLFTDWAGVVRELGKVPTLGEYEIHAKYSCRPLLRHYGGWGNVPAGMLEYARGEELEAAWKDVLDVVAEHLENAPGKPGSTSRTASRFTRLKRTIEGPVYGPPMMKAGPLVYAPTNEAGVMVLFGAVAREQGFAITRMQAAFPDCEAMYEIEPERWVPKKIELEWESKNFLLHLHPVDGCDLIVCWKHNWPECPLEVLELSTMTWHRPGRSPSSP